MKTFWRTSVTIVLLAATLFASWSVDHRPPEALALPLDTIPATIGGWSGTANPPLDIRVIKELIATSYLTRTYRLSDKSISLFVAYYAQQRAGENMHSPKNCLPAAGFEVWRHGMVNVMLNGRAIEVNKYQVEKQAERMLVLYWYQSRRRIMAREFNGKLLLIRDALLEGRTGGSIVRLTLPDQPGAVEDGVAFAAQIIPLVQACLGN